MSIAVVKAAAAYFNRKRRRLDNLDGSPYAKPSPPAIASASVSGGASLGSVLSCSVASLTGMDAYGAYLEYAFYRGSTAVQVSSIPNYTITADDIGQTMKCVVTPRCQDQVGTARTSGTVTPS